jgi:hypothetical protein
MPRQFRALLDDIAQGMTEYLESAPGAINLTIYRFLVLTGSAMLALLGVLLWPSGNPVQ